MVLSYLNSLYIKKFRGINDLELNNLSKINILVGDNNSGKTSVLEAISFFQKPDCVSSILSNSSKRGRGLDTTFELFLDIFPFENEYKEIDITSNINSVKHNIKLAGSILEHKSRIFDGHLMCFRDSQKIVDKNIVLKEDSIPKSKLNNYSQIINMVYVTPYEYIRSKSIENTAKIIQNENIENIINLLKIFDENIEEIEILEGDKYYIYLKHRKNGSMSLSSFGDGIKKAITLATSVYRAKGGILLIDEIETAIYKNMLKGTFSWLVNECYLHNVQLITTTHSLDVIDAFIESMDDIDELACYRLEYYEDELYTNRINGQKLKDIRRILGQDVR